MYIHHPYKWNNHIVDIMMFEEVDFVPDYEEDLPPPHIHRSTNKPTGKQCPVCPGKFTHVRRHVLAEHIPWYIYPDTACWECEINFGQERILDVHIIQEHESNFERTKFNKTHENVWLSKIFDFLHNFNYIGLFSFINSDSKFSSCVPSIFQEKDKLNIKLFLEQNKIPLEVTSKAYPVTSIVGLLHWRILAILLAFGECYINIHHCDNRISIVGSSIVYWAGKRALSVGMGNLENNQIDWRGIRGMKWESLMGELTGGNISSTSSVICVHLGSNDISYNSAPALIEKMKQTLQFCFTNYPNSKIVYSELLSRRVWRKLSHEEGERRRIKVNKEISDFVRSNGGLVICHNQIRWEEKKLFRDDGVHLSDMGNDIFLKDLEENLGVI